MNTEIIMNKQTMSSLEIAELTGKDHAHILRDIRNMEPAWEKVSKSKFGLATYKDAQGKDRPCYNLTKRECLYIATKFNDEARARLVLRWEELERSKQSKALTQAELILQMAQMNVENERRVRELEAQQHALESRVEEIVVRTNTNLSYSTIVGFASRNGIKVSRERASELGRACTGVCKSHGYDMGRVTDPRFGYVKTYPDIVLKEIFEGFYPNARIRVE